MSLELSTIGLFAAAFLITAGSPGPSIAALVSRVVTHGWRDVVPFLAAMWIGEVIWLTASVFGLVALAETFHLAFVILKYLGIAYLLYLAWCMWRAVPASASAGLEYPTRSSKIRMFLAGFSITMGNPKIMVFYVALLPNLVNLETLGIQGWLELCLTLVVLLAVIDFSYVALAGGARRLLKRPAAVRAANRVGAVCMTGAAAGIAMK